MATDLTLNNSKISDFLNGKSLTAPVPEFMYVHSFRPQPNFLTQIEVIIRKADVYFQKNPRKAGAFSKLETLARKLAESLGEMDEQRASTVLFILRDIYQLCSKLPLDQDET